MTYLIIHRELKKRRNELLIELNKHLRLEIETYKQLIKYPDIHVIDQIEKTGTIGIDQVKKLQMEMLFKPLNLEKQVGVISEAHNLTKEAQNALLKTLEEQPEQTIYILTVNNEKSLLPTIRSRCIKIYVRKPSKLKASEKLSRKPEILEQSLHEQFDYAKKITEAEKNESGKIADFMVELFNYYRSEWEISLQKFPQKSNHIADKLEIVSTAQKRLSANTNKLFTLENMLLQLHRLD